MDAYAVFGHPVGHSKSPFIHAAFARQTGQALIYTAIEAPREGFRDAVMQFRAQGGRGANVTVPFKEEAFRLATATSERARLAQAVNTLRFDGADIYGDNTDGAGLVQDLTANLGVALGGSRILLLGAGGAARGAIPSLLAQGPAGLTLANRTPGRAEDLAKEFAALGLVSASAFDTLAPEYDLVINATSASLAGDLPPLPAAVLAGAQFAYDMMYGAAETPFLALARKLGCARRADGLGMLVEQAAEAFFLWRGVRPQTQPVLTALRDLLQHV